MYKKTSILLIFIGLFAGCTKTGVEPVLPPTRTILVYMAADNNLSTYAYRNIRTMTAHYDDTKRGDLLVYIDTNESEKYPRLMRINGTSDPKVLKTYPKQNSASKEVLANVISDVRKFSSNEHLGLVLWSHGTGWLPRDFDTYSFGADKGDVMELKDLCEALPDRSFDFILFDACYMGSIEVMYALRNKTDYIISSPTEILVNGFPYATILKPLFADPMDLQAVCSNFLAYYKTQEKPNLRSATVSLVHTPKLQELVPMMKEVYRIYHSYIADLDPGRVQALDHYEKHLMFDFDNFIDKVVSEPLCSQISNKIDEIVLYKAATPWFREGKENAYEIKTFCGVSSYIPVKEYAALNQEFAETEWARAIGYVPEQ